MDLNKAAQGGLKEMTNKFLEPAFSDMSEKQFELWVNLLEQRTGMAMPVQRKSYLVTSLGLRMQEIGCQNYDEYYDVLNSGVNGEVEWKYLIDRLTVHETRFFRHPSSLSLVEKYVKAKPVSKDSKTVTINAWSAGCSTGEEAYSLAMTIDQALTAREEKSYYGVVATDISLPSIKTGREGVYNDRRIEKFIEPDLLEEYFVKKKSGKYKIAKNLKSRVCFSPMNILEIKPQAIGQMDIIICQNLLIYFDREKRFEIINSMAEMLSPGGIIILGSGEIVGWERHDIRKLNYPDTLAYRRHFDKPDNHKHKVDA